MKRTIFLCVLILSAVSLSYAQDKFPQVTKYKQKCYEIYDKQGPESDEMRSMVREKIDFLCDSIVNASTTPDVAYVDLQFVSKKLVVYHAQLRAKNEIEKRKKIEAARLEREAKLKAEQERKEAQRKAELARKEAEERAKAEQNKALLAILPEAANRAFDYAKKYEDKLHPELYPLFEDICKRMLNGTLVYIKSKTANGIEFSGWVDQGGIPFGVAKVKKDLGRETYEFNGVFHNGKAICGEVKVYVPYVESAGCYKVIGFINMKGGSYNTIPSYVLANMDGTRVVTLRDSSGNISGLILSRQKGGIFRAGAALVDFAHEEEAIKKLYNYMLQKYPQTSSKIVENFPLKENEQYTGGWKSGFPDGVGVIYKGRGEYLWQHVADGEKIREDCYRVKDSDYSSFICNGEGALEFYATTDKIIGTVLPNNNHGIGFYMTSSPNEIILSIIRSNRTIIPNINTSIEGDFIKRYRFTSSGYMYYNQFDIDGETISHIGVGNKGTYWIEMKNETNNTTTMKIMAKDGTYFEGLRLSDNQWIGVHYGKGNYIYVGYFSGNDIYYKGEGYLIDMNDGEIMQQGIWDGELKMSSNIVDKINSVYPVNITEVLSKNKKVLNENSVKLAPTVKFTILEKAQ